MNFDFRTAIARGLIAAAMLLPGVTSAKGEIITSFSGTIAFIDPGGGFFSAATVGSAFSGSFTYPDTAGAPDFLVFDEANYSFSGGLTGGSVTIGGDTVTANQVNVNIQNDHPLSDDEADFANTVLGTTTITAGTPIDVWTVGGLEPGAFFDINDDLFDGHVFEVALISFDTTLFDDLSFRPIPPTLGQVDVAIFTVEEAGSQGQTLFTAVGFLSDAATEIPEPASLALVGPAVAGLLTRTRRTKAGTPRG